VTTAKHNTKVNAHGKHQMNLPKLIENFGSEDKCHDYLEELRWPDGVTCPRCESKKISRISKRRQFDCDSCRYQFSVRAGTIFHDSHLPIWKWFLAVYLMCESKKGISANQLKRTLAVSYKTAWYLCHRIRHAMRDDSPDLLEGIIEVDETYIGGKAKNRHVNERAKRRGERQGKGGGLSDKTMVMGAIARDGDIRLKIGPKATEVILEAFIRSAVDPDEAEKIITDAHKAYAGLKHGDAKHESVDHSADEWVRGDAHTNTVESAWSLLKRSIIGSYHQLSEKHLEAYLDEFSFRFNNRNNPWLFRDTMLKLITEDPMTYKELTAQRE